MAEFIEQEELQGSFETLDEQGTTQEPVEQTTGQTEEVAQAQPEDDLPEKYRGKTPAEIVRMHMEAEKLIGRQAQEVHEVRSLADQLLKQQLSKPVQQQPQPNEELSEDEFFADPRKAVARTVEQHPAVLEAKQAALELKKMKTSQQLQATHPDFASVVADPGFTQWVNASPIRAQMFRQADAEYDFNAANELLSTYKELKAVRTATVSTGTKQATDSALKAASVSTGGSGESSQKIYRRADLIKLSMTDPDRYMQLQPEIMAAYAEGRVK
jgi:hypothetical protein